ncbi:MAG: CinA family nicotinamide mononucleotide deamidase-related protein [Fluviicola sp.]
MNAEIISIGDELLIGQTINTNAAWLGEQLAMNGIKVTNAVTISDSESAIRGALDQAMSRAKLILMTGGLGPTKDDITKKVLADYFNSSMRIDEQVLNQVKTFFEKRNRPMLDVNLEQAEVPENCVVLVNRYGTAPGMWFENEGIVLISMPGVPYEMKGIFSEEVLPRILKVFPHANLYHVTVQTQGKGESFLAEEIKDWENELREEGFDLAYLPSPGLVKLRITSYRGEVDKERIEDFIARLVDANPKLVFGFGEDTLPLVIGKLLNASGQTVGTVESLTVGSLAAYIGEVSGASNYLKGGLITYWEGVKKSLVAVTDVQLENDGVVSETVARTMALNGKDRLGVDWCISTTGFAGPTGGTEITPIGTVCIAIAGPDRVVSRTFLFGDNRQRNIQMTNLAALNYLRCEILGLIE